MFNKFTTAGISHPAQGSAEFDGASDYILIKEDGKGSAFDTQEFTIGAWVSVSDTSYNIIWSYDFTSHASPYYAQHLRIVSGELQFAWNNGVSTYQINSDPSLINNKEWYYVAASFESGAQKTYINGSEVASNTRADIITYYNQEVRIGKGNFAYMYGNLSNVAFWNRALSSDEINSVMWKNYDALEASEKSGLQAWYSLDDVASPSASLATMEALAVDKDATIENTAAITAAINALS